MKRKTPDEMLREFYQRQGDDRDFTRNDDRSFDQVKDDQNYKDIRVNVLRDLGFDI